MKIDIINKKSSLKYIQNRIKINYQFNSFRYHLGCGMSAYCIFWKMKTCIRDLHPARTNIYMKKNS